MIKFELPFPPSNNQYYRRVGNRIVISKRGRRYKSDVIRMLNRYGLAGSELSTPLVVRVELYPPCARRRDVDNYLKGMFDALTEARFWTDDSIVKESTVRLMDEKLSKAVVLVDSDIESGFE